MSEREYIEAVDRIAAERDRLAKALNNKDAEAERLRKALRRLADSMPTMENPVARDPFALRDARAALGDTSDER